MDRNFAGPYIGFEDLAQAMLWHAQAVRLVEVFTKDDELPTGQQVLEAIRSERPSQMAHVLMALTDAAPLEWTGGALDCTRYNRIAQAHHEHEVHVGPDEPPVSASVDAYAEALVADVPITALIEAVLAAEPELTTVELRDRLADRGYEVQQDLVELVKTFPA